MDPLEQAAAFDFRELWREHAAEGRVRPLAEYLLRFPAHEAAVVREWQQLTRPAPPPPPAASPAEVADGRLFGPYRPLRRLGRGGQGEVHLAEDTRVSGRLVAIKSLDGNAVGLSTAQCHRLRREAEALARLDHPSICPLLDAHFDAPRAWLAMRYVRGQTLQAEIAGQPQPRDAARLHTILGWIERLALAAHAAHEAGLLHRDIKPANVMIDQDSVPVLLDFGLAREEDAASLAMTRSGEVFGTLAYMAPEQLQGRRDIDRRVDVYALGVTLFECLAGRSPFAAATSHATTQAVLAGSCPVLRRLNSAVPRDLAVVVATAMDLWRERRYATARELAEDLANVRERRPIRARAASMPLRALRWTQRHPVAAATMTALTFALAMCSLLVFLLASQTGELLAWKRAENAAKLTSSDPSRALSEALLALGDSDQHEIRSTLHTALARNHEAYSQPLLHHGRPSIGVTSMPVTLDDRRALCAGTHCGDLITWRASDGAAMHVVRGPETSAIQFLVADPEARRIWAGTGGGRLHALEADALARGEWCGVTSSDDSRALLVGALAARSARLFVGGVDGRLEWYEVNGRAPIGRRLPDLGGARIEGLWPHPSGRWLLAHTVVLVDDSEGQRTLHRIDVDEARAEVLASFPMSGDIEAEWSPDGTRFLMIEAAGTLQMHRADGTIAWRKQDDAALLSAHFTPDGKRLVTFGLRGMLVLDAANGEVEVRRESVSGRSFEDGWFAPEGDVLVVAIKDATLRSFDTRTWRELAVLGRTDGFARAARWLDDGMLAVFDHVALRAYAVRHPVGLTEAMLHSGPVTSVAYAPDASAIAAAGEDGVVRIVDLVSGTVRRELKQATRPTRALAVGDRLLVAGGEPEAKLWPWLGNGEAVVLRGHSAPIVDAFAVAGSADVITVAADGARAWSASDGATLRTFPTQLGPLRAAAADARLDLIAVAGTAPAIDGFSLSTGRRLWRLDATSAKGLTAPPFRLHIDAVNRRLFAAAPYGAVVHCWGLDADHAYTALMGAGSSIGWAVTDDGGRWLIAAEQSLGTTAWFDATTLAPMPWQPTWQCGNKVSRVQFSGDGRFALMSSYDGTVRLLDMVARGPWSLLPAGHGGALDATFSPSGDRVAVAHKDGTVMVWPTDPTPLARAILARRQVR